MNFLKKPVVTGKVIRTVDQYVVKYVLKPPAYIRKRSSPESLSHDGRIQAVDEFTKAYLSKDGKPLPIDTFFQKGEAINPRITVKGRNSQGIYVTNLSWPSKFKPFWKDEHLSHTLKLLNIDKEKTFLEKFYSSHENLHGHARRLQLDINKPRPTIICLHGYGGGSYKFEHWSFAINQLINKYDIVLKVLPHHSIKKKKSHRYLPPRFPSSDPRFTIEALRQVYFDYQSIKSYLINQGVPEIGLAGISLGGYCSSLIAALDPDHKFVIPIMPVGNLSDIVQKQSRFSGTLENQLTEKARIDRLFSCISPISYESKIGDRMTILAGHGDRVTGLDQAQILQNHFRTKLVTFEGGHILRKGFEKAWLNTIDSFSS